MRLFKKTVSLYLLIFILLITWSAKAEMPAEHKPVPCIGCHQETLNAEAGKSECDGCHDYGLDARKLQAEHNPKICRSCHMGNTIANGDDREIFHGGHSAVNCKRCHTEDNFTIIKIKSDGFKCVSCHGTNAHTIHIKNLAKACPICHGSWAAGKVYQGKEAPPTDMPEKKEKYEEFTPFYFIRNLINRLFGITD